jgi:phage tail P2-like protein
MWRTIEIVPSSIRDDPQVQAACSVIDDELAQIYSDFLPETADPAAAGPSILFWPFINDQVPPLLDVLSWEMHVDHWQNIEGAPLTIEKKRELINESIDWHQHKGTRYAVDRMLQVIFQQGRVTEWYEYAGRPYYFRIMVENDITDADQLGRVLDAVYAVKNVRSWLDTPAFLRVRLYKQTLYHWIDTRQHMTTKIAMSPNAPPPPPLRKMR